MSNLFKIRKGLVVNTNDLYVSGGDVGIGTTTLTNKKLTVQGGISGSALDVAGQSTFRNVLQSPSYESGIDGSGWQINSSANAEFQDLTVRGTMRIYELLINQIRATNGSLFVSSVGRVDSVEDLGGGNFALIFDTGSGDIAHGFLEGDVIRAQRVNLNSLDGLSDVQRETPEDEDGYLIYRSDMTVSSVQSLTVITASLSQSSTPPSSSYEFVRLGNTADDTRQGNIYLTSDDNYAPFIDVVDGITSHADWNSSTSNGGVKVRIGKLDGITSNAFGGALSGYGMWASGSAYLEGGINATTGSIGGVKIQSGKIFTGIGNWGTNDTGFYLDSAGTMSLKDKLTWDGTNLVVNGNVTATSGKIGGFEITTTSITSSNDDLVLKSSGEITGSKVLFTGGKISGSNLSIDVTTLTAKGDSVEISGSNFHLVNGNIKASNVDLSGNINAQGSSTAEVFQYKKVVITAANSGSYLREYTNDDKKFYVLDLTEESGKQIGQVIRFNVDTRQINGSSKDVPITHIVPPTNDVSAGFEVNIEVSTTRYVSFYEANSESGGGLPTPTVTLSNGSTGAISEKFGIKNNRIFENVTQISSLPFETNLTTYDNNPLIGGFIATSNTSHFFSKNEQGFYLRDVSSAQPLRAFNQTYVGVKEGGVLMYTTTRGDERDFVITPTTGSGKLTNDGHVTDYSENYDFDNDFYWDGSDRRWKYKGSLTVEGDFTVVGSTTLEGGVDEHITVTPVAANSSNSGQKFIQSLTFDEYGHVQSVTTGSASPVIESFSKIQNGSGTEQFTADGAEAALQFAAGGATTVSFNPTNKRITFSSTDTNTTYSAGNGITLTGTAFSVAAGDGLTQEAGGLAHSDTSTQASVDNSNGTVIQDVTLDTYGHVTALGSTNLDDRYLLNTTDTLTGDLTVTGTLTAQQFNTEYITQTVILESGSTQFGNSSDDTHIFSGSIRQWDGSVDSYFLGGLSVGTSANTSKLTVAGAVAATSANLSSGDLYLGDALIRVSGSTYSGNNPGYLTHTVAKIPKANYDGFFFDYVIRKNVSGGSTAGDRYGRTGTIMAFYSGSEVNFTDTSTAWFGDANQEPNVDLYVEVVGTDIELKADVQFSNWKIKAIARGI